MLANGVLAGFPVLGMKAILVDGAYHDVDSSVMAFEIAGRAACREGLRKAGARLMEPIMQVWRGKRQLGRGGTSQTHGRQEKCRTCDYFTFFPKISDFFSYTFPKFA